MRTCVLCDRLIPYHYRLCSEHFMHFRKYQGETWFRDLEKMQQVQDNINKKERFTIPFSTAVDMHGNYEQSIVSSKRDRGRPPIHHSIVSRILQIYDENPLVSSRSLSRLVDGKVSHCAANNIIRKYRKQGVKVIY